ncbi:MAG: hypothetical protein V1871_07050 [Planctomycetota bacterium]
MSTTVGYVEEEPSVKNLHSDKDLRHPIFLVLFHNEAKYTSPILTEIAQSMRGAIHPIQECDNCRRYVKQDKIYYNINIAISPGDTIEPISRNLHTLVDTAGGGVWKKIDDDYLIQLGNIKEPEFILNGIESRFPKLTLLAPDLISSCAFLSKLTGVEISIKAKNPIEVVEYVNPFPFRYFGDKSLQFYLETSTQTSLMELVSKLANFHGCVARQENYGIIVDDPTKDEMESLVRDSIKYGYEATRNRSGVALYNLPPAAAVELGKYLDDPDKNGWNYVLEVLLSLDQRPVREKLLSLFQTGQTSNGKPIIGYNKYSIAKNLVLMGEEVVIPYLKESVMTDKSEYRDYHKKEIISLLSYIPTKNAVDAQVELLTDSGPITRYFIPGQIDMGWFWAIDKEDLQKMERLALNYINTFLVRSGSLYAWATFGFSSDMKRATYTLTVGEESSSGPSYIVKFRKNGDYWFITEGDLRMEMTFY